MSRIFVKLKPAELYTHTHTHTCNLLLSSKQIGTICFAILSILISVPTFATGVSSTATSADCDKPTLDTYTGTSNLQVDWQPNNIALHWYDGDTELNVPTASQSCTYDGALTPPTTIPTKTGYTFKGWRVKQAAGCSFTASEVNGMSGVANGFKNDSTGAYGAYEQNASRYGLTTDNSWAVEFNTGIIKGMAKCSNTSGSYATPGTPSDTNGGYCWCQATNYTPNGGNQCNVASPSWVFRYDRGSASDCANDCAYNCAIPVMNFAGFRRAVFGVSQ